jgi:hypothetical protein
LLCARLMKKLIEPIGEVYPPFIAEKAADYAFG